MDSDRRDYILNLEFEQLRREFLYVPSVAFHFVFSFLYQR